MDFLLKDLQRNIAHETPEEGNKGTLAAFFRKTIVKEVKKEIKNEDSM